MGNLPPPPPTHTHLPQKNFFSNALLIYQNSRGSYPVIIHSILPSLTALQRCIQFVIYLLVLILAPSAFRWVGSLVFFMVILIVHAEYLCFTFLCLVELSRSSTQLGYSLPSPDTQLGYSTLPSGRERLFFTGPGFGGDLNAAVLE